MKKDYFTLLEAFNRVGRLLNRSDWDGHEIEEESPYEPFDSSIDPENDRARRYQAARLELFESLWSGSDDIAPPVSCRGVNEQGRIETLPNHIWKATSLDYVFSIKDGRIRSTVGSPIKEYRVRVERDEFVAFLLKKHAYLKRNQVRRGGAPSQYDWGQYEERIVQLYEQDLPPSSVSACAAIIVKEDGGKAPTESQLRDKVSKLAEAGLIDLLS